MNKSSLQTMPRPVDETVKIISEIHDLLPPELGNLFIVPNVVLAVAGMKGYADIHWATHDKKEAAAHIDSLNQHLSQYGIVVNYNADFENDEDSYFGLSMMSYRGFEYSSSRLEAFRKRFRVRGFDSSTGSEGFTQWNTDLHKALKEAVKKGELTNIGAGIYSQGIHLGYPEKAIEDFENCYRTAEIHKDLVEADILSVHPLAEKYHGPIPVYDYYPDSANDQGILENIASARDVLQGFYTSEWMQSLSIDPLFLKTHESEEKKWDEYLEGMHKRRDAQEQKS